MKNLFNIVTLSLTLIACSRKEDQHQHDHAVTKAPSTQPVSIDLMLTDSQIRLADITTKKVLSTNIGQTIVVNGRLVENEDLTTVISSRISGRIEKLFVKETGRMIQKGEPLYQLYSENLLTLQQEFLLAKAQYESLGATEKRYKNFLEASQRKLLLYGLTASQIARLAEQKKPDASVTFLAPSGGILTEIKVAEGQYVSEGDLLVRIENISNLWLEAELYPAEVPLAKIGDEVNVKISGYENTPVDGTINFLSPEFRNNSQIMVMRTSIHNIDLKYKPGMQAQVFFTHSSRTALTVPIDAVIRDGNGSHVYIQRGHNTFHPQAVKTGLEDFEKIEIKEGIHEGDTVAITGAYLLYSELVLKKGTDPMKVHIH